MKDISIADVLVFYIKPIYILKKKCFYNFAVCIKLKTAYFCQNYGTQYPQWLGQCKNCGRMEHFSRRGCRETF